MLRAVLRVVNGLGLLRRVRALNTTSFRHQRSHDSRHACWTQVIQLILHRLRVPQPVDATDRLQDMTRTHPAHRKRSLGLFHHR